jgi:hypothetical protein
LNLGQLLDHQRGLAQRPLLGQPPRRQVDARLRGRFLDAHLQLESMSADGTRDRFGSRPTIRDRRDRDPVEAGSPRRR